MANDKTLKATIKAKGTDIAKYKSDEPNDVIRNWLRNRDAIDFLGLWEQMNNPDLKPIEFDGFKNEAGDLNEE